MGKRVKPNADFQEFLSQQQEWDYRFHPDQALWHSRERQRCVVALMGYLNLLRANGDLEPGEPVTEGGARYQQLSGGSVPIPDDLAAGPPQGAHVLPALIRVGSRDVTQIPKDHRIGRAMQDLVGTVVVLPAEFNSADLMAEQNGLKKVLAECCRRVIDESKPAGPDATGKYRVERELVRRLYESTWIPGATAVFDKLIARGDDQYVLNFKGKAQGKTAAFMRSILRSYKDALGDRRCTSEVYMDLLERDFNRPDINAAVAGERGKVFPIFAEPSFTEAIWKRLGEG